MKNKIAIVGFVSILAAVLSSCSGTVDKNGKDCTDIALNAPSSPKEVFPDSTYTFNTYNASKRKFLVILARKDAAGKLQSVTCVEAEKKACTPLVWVSTQRETLYITYKFHNFWGTQYNTIDKVYEAKVDDCNQPKSEGKATTPPRKGIVGDTGGSGTATTTVDDK